MTLTDMELRASLMVSTSPSPSQVRPVPRTSSGQPVRNMLPRSPPISSDSGLSRLKLVAYSSAASGDAARCEGGTSVDHGGTRRYIRARGSKTSTLVGSIALKVHHVSKYFCASAASSVQSSTATPISFTCEMDFQSMLADPRYKWRESKIQIF